MSESESERPEAGGGDWTDNGSAPGHPGATGGEPGSPEEEGEPREDARARSGGGEPGEDGEPAAGGSTAGGGESPGGAEPAGDSAGAAEVPGKPAFWPEFMEGAEPRDLSKPMRLQGAPNLSVDFPLGIDGLGMPDEFAAGAPEEQQPSGPPEQLFWGLSIQTINPDKLDQYLESVADQESAMHEESKFGGRLVLRSQKRPDRFWVIDAWDEEYAMTSAAIRLRTLSSVAGMVDEPRTIFTVQVPMGRGELVRPGGELRLADSPLPFYLIAENWIKPVRADEYLETQDRFTAELEEEPGFHRRLLLRDVKEPVHYFVIDEWAGEQAAFEAFERRQGRLSETTMTAFLTLVAERGEPDFALGIHG